MARLFGRRRVWAAVVAASVTVGAAAGRGEEPPKVGSTITLPIDGKTERQFKVLTSEKQPDGTYLSELKDVKTGETLTLMTRPGDEPAKGKGAGGDPAAPKAKPPTTPVMPDPPKDKDKDKHPILGRLFGDKDKPATAASTGSAAGGTAKPDAPTEPAKKPGLFGRLFGKKPADPAMPAATVGPVVKPSSPTPPPVLPVPPGGLSGGKAQFPTPATPFPNTSPGGTSEPPRVMPARPQPVAPPVPPFPAPEGTARPAVAAPPEAPVPYVAPPVPPLTPAAPVPVPSPAPAPPPIAVPAPAPVPPIATPPLPAPIPAPAPPAGGVELPPIPLPPIPAPPANVSAAKPPETVVPTGYSPARPAPAADAPPSVAVPFPTVGSAAPAPPVRTPAARPIQIAVPVGYVPPQVAYDRDVEPFAIALQTMTEPSARLTAARALADGRHRSTEGVKSVLFRAAQLDPCGEVRAACVTHLCDLGYYTPQFMSHIMTACNDADPLVRDAAKTACEKMIRR
jgi:hypothetical protein